MEAEGGRQNYDPNAEPNDMDSITALEYSVKGDFLATGDRSGRITVLKIENDNKAADSVQGNWLPHFQYQSHDPEFDFLKSIEIESKINQIKFCHSVGHNNFILSTNDKTIKLWKIGERRLEYKPRAGSSSNSDQLELPGLTPPGPDVSAYQAFNKKIFANAHTYHINSLALNSDMDTFISADDLRINWWNLHDSTTCFNFVDIKPENMEELTEVITAVQFHPYHCNLLAYSSSRGAIKVCDTRSAALCTSYARVYAEPPSTSANKTFISDILNSISDINYCGDGRYIVSRDYLTVKIWDVNMENQPVKTINLHDYLKPMLYDLYTSDIIFDKFEVCCSRDGKSIATGSYSNQLKINHQDQRGLQTIDLPQSSPESTPGGPTGFTDLSSIAEVTRSTEKMKLKHRDNNKDKKNQQQQIEEVRFDEKVLHCAWHPSSSTVAVAGKAGLCLYKV